MHAYVVALQPVQPEPDDQVRERGDHGLAVLRYVRLVEHLAARLQEPERRWILQVLGDDQPVGDVQLREVHLDYGVRHVGLDHPLALDRHRERARERRRGDHALGPDQRPVGRRAAPVRVGGTGASVTGRRQRRRQHGQGDGQQDDAGVPRGPRRHVAMTVTVAARS